MEMILCDWTRMGHAYCLTGAVNSGDGWTIVRPLLHRRGGDMVRNVGWSPFLFDGHARWEVFDLVGVTSPPREPPHVEDVWIREMRSLKRMAAPVQRREILQAGIRPADIPLFGQSFSVGRETAWIDTGKGDRSLATMLVERGSLRFSGIQREGRAGPDYRVTLDVPGLGERCLAVVDHFLLRAAELAGTEMSSQVREMERIVGQMGERIAVRLGLTRPFAPQGNTQPAARVCWLMADSFFSMDDPQP
jgi:hypothetical protein